jgi:hypothetical protein
MSLYIHIMRETWLTPPARLDGKYTPIVSLTFFCRCCCCYSFEAYYSVFN